MNELIKALAVEADFMLCEDGHFYSEGQSQRITDHLQKFVELIVQECANHCDLLLDHKISSEWSRGTHACSKAIKKHFRVSDER